MQTVEPAYEVLFMLPGEQALALIERMGRIAYKSEDKIDPGQWCRGCDGNGVIGDVPCHVCGGSGWTKEPSSHKFVKMILKAERKAKIVMLAREYLDDYNKQKQVDFIANLDGEAYSGLVERIIGYMEDNPAHESVIEHSSASVIFTSNRGFTHELVRHRLAAFTQESTRYCNYSKGKFNSSISVCPDRRPYLRGISHALVAPAYEWEKSVEEAEYRYLQLTQAGVPAQIARDVLPQVTKAEIGITANFREWRHVFKMRDSKNAHPDMVELMRPLHEEFRKRIPIIFD